MLEYWVYQTSAPTAAAARVFPTPSRAFVVVLHPSRLPVHRTSAHGLVRKLGDTPTNPVPVDKVQGPSTPKTQERPILREASPPRLSSLRPPPSAHSQLLPCPASGATINKVSLSALATPDLPLLACLFVSSCAAIFSCHIGLSPRCQPKGTPPSLSSIARVLTLLLLTGSFPRRLTALFNTSGHHALRRTCRRGHPQPGCYLWRPLRQRQHPAFRCSLAAIEPSRLAHPLPPEDTMLRLVGLPRSCTPQKGGQERICD